MDSLQKMIQASATDPAHDVTFHGNYSGRGMFGAECIGISGSPAEIDKVVIDVLNRMADALVDAGINAESNAGHRAMYRIREQMREYYQALMFQRQDKLGHDIIVYWPRLEPEAVDNLVD